MSDICEHDIRNRKMLCSICEQQKNIQVRVAQNRMAFENGEEKGKRLGAYEELTNMMSLLKRFYEDCDVDGRRILFKFTDADVREMNEFVEKRLRELRGEK